MPQSLVQALQRRVSLVQTSQSSPPRGDPPSLGAPNLGYAYLSTYQDHRLVALRGRRASSSLLLISISPKCLQCSYIKIPLWLPCVMLMPIALPFHQVMLHSPFPPSYFPML